MRICFGVRTYFFRERGYKRNFKKRIKCEIDIYSLLISGNISGLCFYYEYKE